MKKYSRYFDLIVLCIFGLIGAIGLISNVIGIGNLFDALNSVKGASGVYLFMIWFMDLLLSVGLTAGCVHSILNFRKGKLDTVAKNLLTTFAMYAALGFTGGLFTVMLYADFGVPQFPSEMIFQLIWNLIVAVAGILLGFIKINGKNVSTNISIPCTAAGLFISIIISFASGGMEGLGLVLAIFALIACLAGIALPLYRYFSLGEKDTPAGEAVTTPEVQTRTVEEDVDIAPAQTNSPEAAALSELKELETLHDAGLVNDVEYQIRKEQIMNKF